MSPCKYNFSNISLLRRRANFGKSFRRCVLRCLRMRMAKSKAKRSKRFDFNYGEVQKAALRNCRQIFSNDDADILQHIKDIVQLYIFPNDKVVASAGCPMYRGRILCTYRIR